jgi:hypothetical protein
MAFRIGIPGDWLASVAQSHAEIRVLHLEFQKGDWLASVAQSHAEIRVLHLEVQNVTLVVIMTHGRVVQ